jgi:polysaccharide pyruvyl transferase WcaK-like protein
MKATIIGGNYVGKGAEAMMEVVVAELRKRLPGIRFNTFSNYTSPRQLPPRASAFEQENDAKITLMRSRGVGDWLSLPISKPLGLSYRYYRHFYDCIKDSDALLDIRGFVFIPGKGVRGANGIGYYIQTLLARHRKVKHIILPQVMGPINGRGLRWLALNSLKKASLIAARDPKTKNVLEGIGVSRYRKVELFPDIAFLFEPADRARRQELLQILDLKEKQYIALTPNVRIYERSNTSDGANTYLESLLGTINFIRTRMDKDVLLIPHEHSATRQDDSWVIERLLERLGDRKRITVWGADASAAEVKAVIGGAYAVVGSRYHSLIAALSLGIPSVATSWSHKYEELMGLLGVREYCISKEDITEKNICDRLAALEENYPALQQTISSNASQLHQQINQLFDQVADVIKTA